MQSADTKRIVASWLVPSACAKSGGSALLLAERVARPGPVLVTEYALCRRDTGMDGIQLIERAGHGGMCVQHKSAPVVEQGDEEPNLRCSVNVPLRRIECLDTEVRLEGVMAIHSTSEPSAAPPSYQAVFDVRGRIIIPVRTVNGRPDELERARAAGARAEPTGGWVGLRALEVRAHGVTHLRA